MAPAAGMASLPLRLPIPGRTCGRSTKTRRSGPGRQPDGTRTIDLVALNRMINADAATTCAWLPEFRHWISRCAPARLVLGLGVMLVSILCRSGCRPVQSGYLVNAGIRHRGALDGQPAARLTDLHAAEAWSPGAGWIIHAGGCWPARATCWRHAPLRQRAPIARWHRRGDTVLEFPSNTVTRVHEDHFVTLPLPPTSSGRPSVR